MNEHAEGTCPRHSGQRKPRSTAISGLVSQIMRERVLPAFPLDLSVMLTPATDRQIDTGGRERERPRSTFHQRNPGERRDLRARSENIGIPVLECLQAFVPVLIESFLNCQLLNFSPKIFTHSCELSSPFVGNL